MEILIDTNTVRSNTFMEQIITKYGFGIVFENNRSFADKLYTWYQNFSASDKRDSLERIQKKLTSEIKYKSNIVDSINSLEIRILKVEHRLEKVQNLLFFASTSYERAEKTVVNLLNILNENLMGGSVQDYNSGGSEKKKKKKKKKKKLIDKNFIKIAVGVVVIGVSVIAIPVTGGSSIAIGAAVGATVVGGSAGVVSGIISEKKGGSFVDGFANGFMVGAVGGAVVGAAVGAVVGGTASSVATKTGAEVVKNGQKVIYNTSLKKVVKKKVVDVGKEVVRGTAKGALEEVIESKKTGSELVSDIGEAAVGNAKSTIVDVVKDELKGKFKNETIGDIVVDGGESVAQYVGESIKEGEKVTVEGVVDSFVDVVEEKKDDLIKDKISEFIFGESSDG